MRMSFVKVSEPMLASVVRERTVRDACAAIKNSEYSGATGIDLHLSCLDSEFQNVECIKNIVEVSSLPILALHYSQDYEYNNFETDEESRIELLLKAVEAGVSAIDIQGYTYDLPSKNEFRPKGRNLNYSFAEVNPKEVVVDEKIIDKQCALIDKIHALGAEVLLSTHPGVVMNCDQIVELALFIEKRKPDIIKIVTPCTNEEELIESFKTILMLKKEVKTPVTFHCSGKEGKLSRIINPILGGHMAFCIERYTASSAYEQLNLKTAASVFNGLMKLL